MKHFEVSEDERSKIPEPSLLHAESSCSEHLTCSAIGHIENFAAEIATLSSGMTPDDIFKPGKVIKFAKRIPVLPDNMHGVIWVHRAYSEIAAELQNQIGNCRSFHLLGSPGTGKSSFGVLWLMFLALKKQKILYRSKDKIWLLFDFSCRRSTTQVFKSYIKAGRFVGDSVWLIIDGASKPVLHPGPILQCVSDSPRSYMEFAEGCGKLLFMNPWEWEDCELCSRELPQQIPVDELELRFFYAGGTPRYVFNPVTYTLGDLKSMIDNAANLVENFEHFSAYSWDTRSSDKLVHLRYIKHRGSEPCVDHTTTRVLYPASEYTKEVIHQRLMDRCSSARVSFIERLRGLSSTVGLREAVFERMSHEVLSQGGCFLMKSLDADRGKSPHEFRKSLLPQRAVCKHVDRRTGASHLYAELFTNRSQIHVKEKLPIHFLGWEHYVKLVVRQEGGFTSFMSPGKAGTGLIFQVSVSPTSPIKMKYVQETIDFLDEWCEKQGRAPPPKYWFVFVVPEDIFVTFSKQKLVLESDSKHIERLEQFALMVKV